MDDLARWRDEFPILSRSVYMISNSLGAMPRRTARDLAEYADTWATRGVRGWEERLWEMPLEVGNKIARVIGAPPGTVSMHENVTTAQTVALSCVRPAAGRTRTVNLTGRRPARTPTPTGHTRRATAVRPSRDPAPQARRRRRSAPGRPGGARPPRE